MKATILACSLILATSFTQAASLPASVQQNLKAAGIPASALGVAAIDLSGQSAPIYWQADQPLNPASTMKIVTSWAAINLLGPVYHWQTQLLSENKPVNGVLEGPLYLRGSGDPKLTIERMWLWLRDLKAAGVNEIRGPLVLDGSAFSLPADRTIYDDDGSFERAFMVSPDALISNFRTVRVTLDTTSGKAQLRADPDLPEVRISNNLAVGQGDCAAWAQRVQQRAGQVSGAEYLVQFNGEMPAGCKVERYVPVLTASRYTAALFWQLWRELGGKGSNLSREGTTPATAQVLATSTSPDLVEMVRDINKYSNNLMAQQLFLTIGKEAGQNGATTDIAASNAIRSWYQAQNLPLNELVLENGSGLSRSERISPKHLAQILQAAARDPLGSELISALPIVGEDGTMKKRLKSAAGSGHIKTGTLRDVRAVAGIIRDDNGRDWAVAAIVNHPNAPKAMPVMDGVLQSLMHGGWR